MTKFQLAKDYIVENGTRLRACSGELNRIKASKNIDDILQVVKDNLSWVYQNSLFIGVDINTFFTKNKLAEFGLDNTGEGNTGFSNAGNDNAGNRNAGNRNAGYSNAGNDNAGAFNNSTSPNYIMFNKPSIWSYEDFVKSKAYSLLSSVDTALWVPNYAMSDQEKKDFPYYITTNGYVKNIPYKEAFTNAWNNWTVESRQAFIDLPNFDWRVFTSITGVEEPAK